jgi:hypothetical protein
MSITAKIVRKIISKGQGQAAAVTFTRIMIGREASTVSNEKGVFRGKSASEAWTDDPGAYPIMFGIGLSLTFAAGFGLYYFLSSPDVRVMGEARNKLFRGDLNEYTRETETEAEE